MIRIIKSIVASDLSTGELSTLPMIPATGTANIVRERTDHGHVQTIQIRANMSDEPVSLFHPLALQLTFDNGDTITIGSADLPVHLSVSRDSFIQVTTKYTAPIAL